MLYNKNMAPGGSQRALCLVSQSQLMTKLANLFYFTALIAALHNFCMWTLSEEVVSTPVVAERHIAKGDTAPDCCCHLPHDQKEQLTTDIFTKCGPNKSVVSYFGTGWSFTAGNGVAKCFNMSAFKPVAKHLNWDGVVFHVKWNSLPQSFSD